eukprot:Plantae.Rhodophyta-Palmaria_palmata.ctg4686.p1 GENE.Plantae.Rhodophyta-Palmaria_palmata.ctg4686~~Plantae.Rhodophyta-Palmaria_palmata.ctg4686.p1  ORF type:complete len:276 (-),score=72.87 Plantae.Rhodophyta-Palmaria_palmata.ctg4686:346-1143(-)
MVSRENSTQSASLSLLETERNHLKGELLDVTEAFTKLKTRYDDLKKTNAEQKSREDRLQVQNVELKQCMIDLSSWSNDLKANTQKKLGLACEAASRYSSEKIAFQTAAQENAVQLDVAHSEIDSLQEALTAALAKNSKLEVDLHQERDSGSANVGLISTTRDRLATAERERAALRAEKSTLTAKLSIAESKIVELSELVTNSNAAEDKCRVIEGENLELKAKAFDNLTKIGDLEGLVAEKDKENKEVLELVEELMKREEEREGIK